MKGFVLRILIYNHFPSQIFNHYNPHRRKGIVIWTLRGHHHQRRAVTLAYERAQRRRQKYYSCYWKTNAQGERTAPFLCRR